MMTTEEKVKAIARVLRSVLRMPAVKAFMPANVWNEADRTLSAVMGDL